MQETLRGLMIYNVAYFGQYIVPGLLLLGAAKSFYDRYKRKKLLSDVRDGATPAIDPLTLISCREFEMLVGQFFREKGYKVHETGGAADGGVDLRLTTNDFKTYRCSSNIGFFYVVHLATDLSF